jgi:20S proteasome subunit alpha 5
MCLKFESAKINALLLHKGIDSERLCGRSRPFGVALLVAGVDEYGPSLYHTDPSGTFVRYEAKAIGAGSEGAQTQLQESYSKSMTLAEAETLALNTLKQVHFLSLSF